MAFLVLLDNELLYRVLVDNISLNKIVIKPNICDEHEVHNPISAYRYTPLSHFVYLCLDFTLDTIKDTYGARKAEQFNKLLQLDEKGTLYLFFLGYIEHIYNNHKNFLSNIKFISCAPTGVPPYFYFRVQNFAQKKEYINYCKWIYMDLFNKGYKQEELDKIRRAIHVQLKDYLDKLPKYFTNVEYICAITNKESGNTFHGFTS